VIVTSFSGPVVVVLPVGAILFFGGCCAGLGACGALTAASNDSPRRQASEAERARLYRLRDALGLRDNDAFWSIVMSLEHYHSFFRAYPDGLAEQNAQCIDNGLRRGANMLCTFTTSTSTGTTPSPRAHDTQSHSIIFARGLTSSAALSVLYFGERVARTSGSVLAGLAALGVTALGGCLLINLDALDPAPYGGSGTPDAWAGAADESSTENEVDAPGAWGSYVSDAPQGGEVLDGVTSSGDVGSTSGSTSGAASGHATGSTSGSASGTASGSTSGSGSGTSGSSGTSDGHKCGSNGLKPQAAVASSVQSAANSPASYAIDGVFSTRWGSAVQTDPSWIYMDFGAPVFVDELDILWQGACATAYDIDVSNDALNWTNVKSVTGTPPSWQVPPTGWTMDDVEQGLSTKGRYLRVHGTARCNPMYGYSIWEMRAFGDTDASCAP